MQAPGLSDRERRDISGFLERVQKQYEKTFRTSQGPKGRYMQPNFMQENIISEARAQSRRGRNVRVLCLPYFLLKRYTAQPLPSKSPLHPIRTLLQSHFPSAGKELDLQQVICALADTPKEHCIHVPQLWCLILDDSKS